MRRVVRLSKRWRGPPRDHEYFWTEEDVLTPTDEKDLSAAIAGADGPLQIMGGGTRSTGRKDSGASLTTTGISGITLYEPGALTMVAKAGTPLAEIEAALAEEGQMLAFEPQSLSGVTRAKGHTTIGGVFATNASGPRRVQSGAARDFLLGVRFVDGQGAVIKNGGRVMKNVTGYDLVKLMAGSFGTLGVLSEVSFKVLPRPDAVETVFLANLSEGDAINAMSLAMTSPFGVSGALHAPACIEEEPTTMLRLEGLAASVSYRADRLEDLLKPFGATNRAEGRESWEAVRQMGSFSQTVRGKGGALWHVSLKASQAAQFMASLAETFGCLYHYDWAGGRIDVWLGRDGDMHGLHKALQNACAAAGGHARLVHGPATLADTVPLFQPEPAPLARLAEGLRKEFDPRGILNAGLMA